MRARTPSHRPPLLSSDNNSFSPRSGGSIARMAKLHLYDDIMQVVEVDADGKRFDKGAQLRDAAALYSR